MQVGEAFITVRPDTSKFGSELTRETETAGRTASSGLSQALTAGIAVAGFSKLVGSASELQQAIGGTTAVFGEAGAAIDEFAATSADAVGLSEASYRQLASFAGNQLQGLGFSAEEAAAQTNTLITMGADLAATFGGTTQEAVSALSATFRGEYDPVERYVAGLRASTVAAKAVEMGLATSGGAISNYARGQATLALLVEGSANAQGQFAREADTAAGAQARAAAAAEDSAASMGTNLLPAYQSGVAVAGKLAAAFGALPAPLQTAGLLLGGFAAFRGPITGAFSAISAAVQGMALRFREAGGGLAGLKTAISPGALGVGAAVAGIGLIANAWAEQNRRAQEAEDRMKALADAFATGGAAAAGDTLLTQISDQAPEAVEALNAAGVSTVDLVNAAQEGGGALEELVHHVGDVGDLSSLTTIELGRLAEASATAGANAEDLATATDANAEAAAGSADSIQEEADALTEVADSADAAKKQLDALFGIQMSVDEAATAVQQTTDDLSQSIRDNGRNWNENTQAGRDNMAAAREAAGAIRDMTIAHRAAGGTMSEVTGRSRSLTDGLRSQLRQAGLTKGQIDTLIGTYGRVPRSVLTSIAQTGADGVISALQRIYQEALRAASAVRQISGSLAGGGSYGGARAEGGPVVSGMSYLVGERGPELFTPGGSGAITPNGGGSGWGGGVTVVVEGNVIGDVDRFADEIAFRAAEKISRGAI